MLMIAMCFSLPGVTSQRLAPGQRILCQILDIRPLALLVSLPNQLLGHVPATHISSLLTERLEKVDAEPADSTGDQEEDDDIEGKSASASSDVPDLADMFTVGQYLTAVVEEVHPSGARSSIDFSKARDEVIKAAKRVELSIDPEKVNAGVAKRDLVSGFVRRISISIFGLLTGTLLFERIYLLSSGQWKIMGIYWTLAFLRYQDSSPSRRPAKAPKAKLRSLSVKLLTPACSKCPRMGGQ
jgi:hypothetical protein